MKGQASQCTLYETSCSNLKMQQVVVYEQLLNNFNQLLKLYQSFWWKNVNWLNKSLVTTLSGFHQN